jgi:hypothetical protein
VVIPRCGHAPQIEKSRLVNHLISRYLRDALETIPPALDPRRILARDADSRPHRSSLPAIPRRSV